MDRQSKVATNVRHQPSEVATNVGHQPGENKPLLCNTGRRGSINSVLPQLQHCSFYVEWTQFSLKQMCSIEIQWDKDMILLCYYLYCYYANRNNITSHCMVHVEPSYLIDEVFQNNDNHLNGDCNVVTIFQHGDQISYSYVLL